MAKRYGKRVMAWAVPKENKHNQFVDRSMYAEFWDPGLKYVFFVCRHGGGWIDC